MRAMFDNIKAVFTKDTAEEGESSKLLIVLRILFTSIIIYSIIGAVYCICQGYFDGSLCFVITLAIYALMFYGSYHCKTITLVVIANIISIIDIVAGYFLLGPLVSIQNFFIVVIVACYFSGYGHYRIKGIYTLCVFAMYFILQTRFGKIAAFIPFSVVGQRFMQFLNLFVSFWCVALV